MTKIKAHPFGGVSREAIGNAQQTVGGGRLQFVGEGVVVAGVAIVQETSDGT